MDYKFFLRFLSLFIYISCLKECFAEWEHWGHCSVTCGEGIRKRHMHGCHTEEQNHQYQHIDPSQQHEHTDCHHEHTAHPNHEHIDYHHEHTDHPGHEHNDHSNHEHTDYHNEHTDHSNHEHSDHADHEHTDHSDHDHTDHSSHEHTDHSGHEHSDHANHEHTDHANHEHTVHYRHETSCVEFQKCYSQACPVDEQWSSWNTWSHCSRTCGEGMMSRQRLCSGHRHAHYGQGCTGSSTESRSCRSRQSCPMDGGWSGWSLWSHCSGTCGRGTTTRQRTCTNPSKAHGGASCVGTSTETKSCRTHHHCPTLVVVVNGGWSGWSLWSHCSGTCGRGTMTRLRTCTNPRPAHGGASCVGTSTETQSCRTHHHCPIVDGGWSGWSLWSHCSGTCGRGTMTRQRTCTNPRPAHGSASCVGTSTETKSCSTYHRCPTRGGWSQWSPFSHCSNTCGDGMMYRTRTCSNPRPVNGGADCVGLSSESIACKHRRQCPVDGQWSSWSPYSSCSTTCGYGTTIRYRSCSNPAPLHRGKSCYGSNSEKKACNIAPCPVDGQWGKWSLFSQCSTTCGKGTQQRQRTCSSPAPSNGGKTCVGDDKETAVCEIQHCPVDGQWSKWSLFSQCSTTCGKGTQQRHRTCSNPTPSNGGKTCSGDDKETAVCEIQHCLATTTPSRGIHLVTIRKRNG